MPAAQRIVIVGDGAMGTVCAIILASEGYGVSWWSYNPDQAQELIRNRENKRFLPGFPIPPEILITSDDKLLFHNAFLVISAVPCKFLRSVWQRLAPQLPDDLPIVSITKGIENDTLLCPTQIIEEVTGKRPLAALSGPNIAEELARRLPATSTIAGEDIGLCRQVQKILSSRLLRIYTNKDLLGVELAGATKNVIAIAAGIIDGLRAGDNAKAALLTRGLVEITRLGLAMGAEKETFAGLSGMGDLVTTCISPKGRNRCFGEYIGKGKSVAYAQGKIPGEVEGINTCRSLVELAQRHQVEMPICRAVYEIVSEGKSVMQAIADLMGRELKSENTDS